MNSREQDQTFLIDRNADVPYLDQWLGQWFIEHERGQALFGVVRQLNLSVHLAQRATGSPAQDDPHAAAAAAARSDVPIDYERAPLARTAYGYRVVNGVAVLELKGSLMKQEASATESTSTVMMRRTARKLMADDSVKAVIFEIDSPGGTVAGAYELAADIGDLAAAKPVHAHASNLVASAAYLMASQMRSISAAPSTLVGSLGTFGVVYDMSGAAAMEGVKVHLLKGRVRGKTAAMKGAGTPGTEISAEQLARMQQSVDDMNEQFIQAVIGGPRKPQESSVESWFSDAGVWIATRAVDMGLIDRVESFDQMLSRLADEVNGSPASSGGTGGKGGRGRAEGTSPTKQELAGGEPAAGLSNVTAEAAAADCGASAPHADAGADAEHLQEVPMSTTQQAPAGAAAAATGNTGGTVAPQAQTGPRPATIAELKSAFPGDANAAFILNAAELGWTLNEAKAAHDVIEQRVSASSASAGAGGGAATPKPRVGVRALDSAAAEQSNGAAGAAGAGGGDAVDAFNAAVEEQMKKPGYTSRKKAIAAVCQRHPDLHQDYLLATNGGKAQRERIADRFTGLV